MASTAQDLRWYLSGLEQYAVNTAQVPPAICRMAAARTMTALGDTRFDVRTRTRAAAYFWTVVRRAVTRDADAVNARARFLLAAVVEDLVDAGRSAEDIWAEIEDGWAQGVPLDVLEEYRQRLCA